MEQVRNIRGVGVVKRYAVADSRLLRVMSCQYRVYKRFSRKFDIAGEPPMEIDVARVLALLMQSEYDERISI